MKRNRLAPVQYALCGLLLVMTACGSAPSEEAEEGQATNGGAGFVIRVEEEFDQVLPTNYQIERVATGFVFSEGPVWADAGAWGEAAGVIFSDSRNNAIYRWDSESGEVDEVLRPVSEAAPGRNWFLGPAGLAWDPDGNLLICDQAERRISRFSSDGERSSLVEHFEEQRLNSPNDLVWGPDGWLYFTDPPFGLAEQDDDADRDLDFNGIFRVSPDGETVELLSANQSRPNGLAFSPDGAYLYVSNSDPYRKNWVRYPVREDGTLGSGRVFFDATFSNDEGLPDGLVLDRDGRVYATGPGGVWVFSPDGYHLGTIRPDEPPANLTWGGDGRWLYMTARTGLYRIRLQVPGATNGAS